MSAFRSNKRGTPIIKKRVKGVGEIRRAAGTNDPDTITAMEGMIPVLVTQREFSVLTALKDGELSFMEVFIEYQKPCGDVRRLLARESRGLIHAFEEWLVSRREDYSPTYFKDLRTTKRKLESFVPSGTIEDVAEFVEVYRDDCAGKHHTAFNNTRHHIQAFVKATVGRRSELYLDLSDIPELPVERKRRPYFTPSDVKQICKSMPSVYGEIAWSLAMTGMRKSEYWGELDCYWEPSKRHLYVHGHKKPWCRRWVPLAGRVVQPKRKIKRFRETLTEASGGEMTPHDLRRCFARWTETAGIDRTHRRIYLGHRVGDVTDLYEDFGEGLEKVIGSDAKKLKGYVGGDYLALKVV